jgi:hypothetical protein
MNWQHVGVLVYYDLLYIVRSATRILFLVFYSLFWFWFLWKLGEGMATWLAQPEGHSIASWILEEETVRFLFIERPATLSAYFIIAMTMVPGFVIWGASNQTAADIKSRHLRFLIPRCGRFEIYLGRFLGAVLFITLLEVVVGIIATLISLQIDNMDVAMVLLYALQVNGIVIAYSLPYIALMAILSAWMASAGLAVVIAMSIYSVLAMVIGVFSIRWPEESVWFSYLLPNALKEQLINPDGSLILLALAALVVYLLIYFWLGWYIFRVRDV